MQNVLAMAPRVEAVEHALEASDGAGEGARDEPAVLEAPLNRGGGGGMLAASAGLTAARVHVFSTELQSG